MDRVFLLQHVREYGAEREHESVRLIGVYSSRELAERAKARVEGQPGFRDHREGFSIDEHALDRSSWLDGFGSGPDDEPRRE